MHKNDITELHLDEISNAAVILPENILLVLQWFEGQKLSLEIQEDGSLLMTPIYEKSIKKTDKEMYFE